jgi:hypothetical protein
MKQFILTVERLSPEIQKSRNPEIPNLWISGFSGFLDFGIIWISWFSAVLLGD